LMQARSIPAALVRKRRALQAPGWHSLGTPNSTVGEIVARAKAENSSGRNVDSVPSEASR